VRDVESGIPREIFSLYIGRTDFQFHSLIFYFTNIHKIAAETCCHFDALVGYEIDDQYRDYLSGYATNFATADKDETEYNTAYMEYDWNFHKILLPIPKKEMDANPNMKQNPGYVD
jgi:hypothetical protein